MSQKKIKRSHLTKTIKRTFFIPVLILTLLALSSHLLFEYKYVQQKSVELHKNYINTQKQTLKHEVDIALQIIQYEQNNHKFHPSSGFITNNEQIRQEIIKQFSHITLSNNRYLFMSQWDGLCLMGPGKGKNVLNAKDANGVNIVQELIKISKNGSGFITYQMPKFSKDANRKKIAYVVGLPQWHAYIGSGIYIDNLEKEVQDLTTQAKYNFFKKSLYILISAMSIIIITFLITHKINQNIFTDFNTFENFFYTAISKKEKINLSQIKYSELHKMAKKANQMLDEKNEIERRLQATKNHISNIIDSMPSLIIVINKNKLITQWNKEAEKVTGVTIQEAHKKPVAQIIPYLKDEYPKIEKTIFKKIKHSNIRKTDLKNKTIHHLKITIYPLHTSDGAVIRIDDVSEQIQLEEMIIQSEKMLSIGGLAAGMAHEINNPLAGMMQSAQVILNRLSNTTLNANIKVANELNTNIETIYSFIKKRKILDMLIQINESGKRAANIVQNMLSFTKKTSNIMEKQEIPPLIDKCISLSCIDYNLKKQFDFKQIKIIREYEKELPHPPCAAGKIQQVIMNILKNGAEAMHKTTDEPTFIIRIFHDKTNQFVRIQIQDNGPGMPKEVRNRIFEPFFTTKPTDKGTGLGLSVSYFIITENHKGEITVHSEIGKGTTFNIALPITPQ